jgi:hypothetical protein
MSPLLGHLADIFEWPDEVCFRGQSGP